MKLAVVVLLAAALYYVHASDVVILTADNFDAQVASGTWMVKFYAPWCGHCKRMIPQWEEFAKDQKGMVNVAKVDCTVEKAIAAKFGIRGFPTLKMIKDGKVYDYSGARDGPSFTKFVNSDFTGATSKDLSSFGGAPAATKSEEPAGNEEDIVVLTDADFASKTAEGAWLVKYYAPWCGHCKRLAPTWAALATATKDKSYNVARIDCTTNGATCKEFGVRGYPTIKFLSGGKFYDYKGQRTHEALDTFATSGFTGATGGDMPTSTGKEEL